MRAFVPGTGHLLNDCSNPGTGLPGTALPAPLSNRIRTCGRASNAARAEA